MTTTGRDQPAVAGPCAPHVRRGTQKANNHPVARDLIDAFRVLRIELRAADERIAAAAGIKPRDLDVLDVIDREGACTPKHLTNRTGIAAATLTGVLSRLASDGWISREVDPQDARSARVSSTQRFEEVRALFQQAGGPVQRVFDDIRPKDHAAVLDSLRTLSAEVHNMGAAIPDRQHAHPDLGSTDERTR